MSTAALRGRRRAAEVRWQLRRYRFAETARFRPASEVVELPSGRCDDSRASALVETRPPPDPVAGSRSSHAVDQRQSSATLRQTMHHRPAAILRSPHAWETVELTIPKLFSVFEKMVPRREPYNT